MILRHARDLSTADKLFLNGKVWNIENVSVGNGVVVRLSQMGSKRVLDLLPNDLVELVLTQA